MSFFCAIKKSSLVEGRLANESNGTEEVEEIASVNTIIKLFNNSGSGKPSSLGHHIGDKRSTPEEKAKFTDKMHSENENSGPGTEGSQAAVNSSVDNHNNGLVEANSKTSLKMVNQDEETDEEPKKDVSKDKGYSSKVEKQEKETNEKPNKGVSKDEADSSKVEKQEQDTEEKPNKCVSKDKTGVIIESVKQEDKPAPEEKYKRIRFVSEDEAKARLKWCVDELKRLEENDEGKISEIYENMIPIHEMYVDYKTIRRELGDVLTKEGFVEVTVKIMKEFNRLGIFTNETIWLPTLCIYLCWTNYSDASDAFAEALAENGVVLLLTMNISHKPYLETYSTSEEAFYVLESSLGILHNIARVGTMKHHFDENKTSEALVPFLSQDDELLKILANLIIAHTQDDDANKKQILGPETIECMVQWTEEALNSTRKRHNGFPPFELIDGLNKLAVNDNNKLTIVEKGAIRVLVKMMMGDDVTDLASATQMVWTLAFDKDVRQKLKDDTVLMAVLEQLKSSQESRVNKNASGALWVINGENDITNQKRPQSAVTQDHIMLSYSWSDQGMVIKIRDKLRAAGYNVWIDIEKMGGSTLEAMALAIEQASVVLLCMSEQYKNSPNCRTEAEYTFQLRKTYIPLMMQKKYKPDGWLGILLGAKLYFDFSEKYPTEKPFSGLVKELRRTTRKETFHSSNDETDGTVVATRAPKTLAQPDRRRSTLISMKSSFQNMGQPEVKTWLQKEAKLTTCLKKFKKFKIDGKLLTQLMVMRKEAPEFFYQSLKKQLNMDLTEILQFTNALDELGT